MVKDKQTSGTKNKNNYNLCDLKRQNQNNGTIVIKYKRITEVKIL